ncbi:MAG: protein-L-isoaspartate(D-aspartate) O-methyltransferase [Planctomycetes bacterium]|nr:protein-L-isoaspartate(D-aspartate) O-methyltransferase [Planctomycetota bacterium]
MKSLIPITALCVAGLLAPSEQAVAQRNVYEQARRKMVSESVEGAGVKSKRVIESMLATPRHQFVRANLRSKAYFDMALPIGDKQTISSPFIVAYMTESIDPQPSDKVLEIGTGSGYHAAILSPLVKQVYSIEIVPTLGRNAARTLARLGYKNVFTRIGDGYQGWAEHAPFDKIIVTCSPEKVPKPLVDQLAEGGLMVIPVGERYQQTLYLFRKKDGKLQSEALRPTLFVPMTGRAEASRDVKPDPLNPKAANGGFEEKIGENGFVPGWYYQRQLTVVIDKGAPEGMQFVNFKNQDDGRAAHLLQGFSVDGRSVKTLALSASIKYENVRPGNSINELPLVAVSFYDSQRRELSFEYLGPFRGTADWHRKSKSIRVPPLAREGILRIGLFGATGEISFDNVRMEKGR